ncbi:MAG: hypothetical protein IJY06_01570 [Oscillospiraceae bacterium]|nr:hypothetical protein [Oscillospiraceae bacterium]
MKTAVLNLLFLLSTLNSVMSAQTADAFGMQLIGTEEQSPYTIVFSKEESEGRIDTFDVSKNGMTAVKLHTQNINVYDDVNFSYSIKPSYTHCNSTVQWDRETLVIYTAVTDQHWDYQYFAIKVYGYEDYEVYTLEDTEENLRLWENLPFYTEELQKDNRYYYISEGNLLYQENGKEASFYIADGSYFHPAILTAPVVVPLCIYAFVNRKKLFHIDGQNQKSE